MRLYLIRTLKSDAYTIGKLYVETEQKTGNETSVNIHDEMVKAENMKHIADTLEPVDRNLYATSNLRAIKMAKRKGLTAIPYGTYRVLITKSRRLGKWLPLLLRVPGFEGIRIHSGNTLEDTAGCILVGCHVGDDVLTASRETLRSVMALISDAMERSEPVEITIR